MKNKIIAIAGGSGAGKTTVAFALRDLFPDKVSILHLDDYYIARDLFPVTNDMKNCDDPQVIDFVKLEHDINTLSSGEEILIYTKNERDNPDYYETFQRKEIIVKPNTYILLEGYLSLFKDEIRKHIDVSFFLDVHTHTRMSRRRKFVNDKYVNEILLPVHVKYVEPTKTYATHIINCSDKNIDEIIKIISSEIL